MHLLIITKMNMILVCMDISRIDSVIRMVDRILGLVGLFGVMAEITLSLARIMTVRFAFLLCLLFGGVILGLVCSSLFI